MDTFSKICSNSDEFATFPVVKKSIIKSGVYYTDLELEYRRQQFPYVPYSD